MVGCEREITMGQGTYNTLSEMQAPPEASTKTTPQAYAGADHSFTLQTIMELQKSTGQLTEAVNSLKIAIEKQDLKLDKVGASVVSINNKVYAAGVVLAIFLVVSGFIVNKSWDLVVEQVKITAQQTAKKTQASQ